METERLIYLLKREAIDHGKADYKHLVAAELERLHDKVQELEETHEIQLAAISIAAHSRRLRLRMRAWPLALFSLRTALQHPLASLDRTLALHPYRDSSARTQQVTQGAQAKQALPTPDAYLYMNDNHRGVSLEWHSDSALSEGTDRQNLYTEQQIREAIAAAVAKEREACAKCALKKKEQK